MPRRALRPLVVAALLLPAAAFAPGALRDRVHEVRSQRGFAGAHALPNLVRARRVALVHVELRMPSRDGVAAPRRAAARRTLGPRPSPEASRQPGA